ncbi:MAG: inositol monophosphatase family protein [Anaerolineae bacterium]|jgi:myo-inositol-1(or 4)-monophosphatase
MGREEVNSLSVALGQNVVLQIAISIAREAGTLVRSSFGHVRRVEFKGAVDPVTEVDTQAEDLIRIRLRAAFPSHRILAEEAGGGEWRRPGPPIWLVDPLDGTNNFAHSFPHVGISLALVNDGEPMVGVIYDPLRDETFAAAAGSGAALNGEAIHVSGADCLEDAFLATGFPYNRRTAPDNNIERLDHFLRRSQGVRRAGAATLDLAYVACGRFDGFWEIRLKPWDVAAGVLLVREAGGQVTDFAGSPDCLSGAEIVGSNGRIHGQMLEVITKGAAAPRPDS